MASDAKIDELIDSLDKLVATLAKKGRAERAESRSTTSRREVPSASGASAGRELDREIQELQRLIDLGEELDIVENSRLKQLEKEAELIRSKIVGTDILSRAQQETLETYRELIDEGEALDEEQQRELENLTNLEEATREYEKQLHKLQKEHKKHNTQLEVGVTKGKQLATTLGFKLGGAFETLIDVVPLSIGEIKGLGSSLVNVVKSGELAIIALSGIYNAALEVADAGAAFVGATGAATSMTDSIAGARNELRGLGVDGVKAGQATQALFKDFSDFSNLSEGMRTTLSGQAALLDNIGVSMGTTAGIFDQATKSLGYTSSELVGLTQDIQNVAQSVGKTSEEVFSDFGRVAESLAFYGKDAIKVFTELEKQSKATGLAVDKLVSISGKAFDTFDGAGQKIGRLNAILGGPYLNSIDMLNASEAERIEMLKQSMDMSGQVFSDLNKFEQLAIADALGVGVEDARRMFGNLSAAQQMNIREQEKIKETAKNAMKQMDKLTAAVQSLFVAFEPLVNIIIKFADGIAFLLDSTGGKAVFYFAAIVGGLYALGNSLTKVGGAVNTAREGFSTLREGIGRLGSPLKTIRESFAGGAGGLADEIRDTADAADEGSDVIGGSFIDTFKELMEAVKGSYKEILAFGGAILMIGGGIKLAATGLAELVKAFDGITNAGYALGAILVVMAAFAGMLYILTTASLTAVAPMYAIGGAFALIGLGIGLAAFGLAKLVESFASLGENGLAASYALGAVVAVMLGFVLMVKFMVPAIAALASASAFAAVPIAALGLAFLAIGAGVAIAAFGLSVLVKSFGGLIGSLDGITTEKLDMLKTLGIEAFKLGAAAPGVFALAASFGALGLALLALGPLAAVMTVVSGLAGAFTGGRGADGAAGEPGAAGAAGRNGATGSSVVQPIVKFSKGAIVVKIGDKELKDLVIEVLKDPNTASELSGFGGR